mgnify:CR=1 FL=1
MPQPAQAAPAAGAATNTTSHVASAAAAAGYGPVLRPRAPQVAAPAPAARGEGGSQRAQAGAPAAAAAAAVAGPGGGAGSGDAADLYEVLGVSRGATDIEVGRCAGARPGPAGEAPRDCMWCSWRVRRGGLQHPDGSCWLLLESRLVGSSSCHPHAHASPSVIALLVTVAARQHPLRALPKLQCPPPPPPPPPPQVRRAYRNLLTRAHPDKPGGDAAAFRRIQSAYDVLSDPGKVRSGRLGGWLAGWPGAGCSSMPAVPLWACVEWLRVHVCIAPKSRCS